jgi:hypothetical protein
MLFEVVKKALPRPENALLFLKTPRDRTGELQRNAVLNWTNRCQPGSCHYGAQGKGDRRRCQSGKKLPVDVEGGGSVPLEGWRDHNKKLKAARAKDATRLKAAALGAKEKAVAEQKCARN